MRYRRQILALNWAITLSTGAIGAEFHDHPHEHAIPEIVVTADPLGNVDSHFAAPLIVMDEKALRKQSTRSIGAVVANELGVSSSDFGANVGRPIIRGLGGGRVRVLEGGIGSMDLSTISADHGVSIEPIFANQIEILRGPATLLYGSGASGGLVNVANGRILKDVPERPEAELYNHYDTASDGWLGAFKIDAGLGSNLALHIDGLKRRSHDVDIPGFAAVDPQPGDRPGSLPNSDAETENFAAGASLVGEDGFLGFNISRFTNDYGVPGGHHDEDADAAETGTVADGGTRIDQQQTRYDVGAAYTIKRFHLERLKLRWGYNDYGHDEIESSGEVGTEFANDEWEGRIEIILEPLGRWDGVVGFQARDKEFEAVGEEVFIPPAELDNQAMFLFEKAEYGEVHVDFGLRLEAQHTSSVAFAKSPDFNLFGVSAGGTWAYAAAYEIGLSASRSQRAPTIEELFAEGPHLATNTFEIGDVNLGEETSTNVDVFWHKTDGRYRFGFTFFYNDIDDFIFLQSNDLNNDGIADRVEEDFLETGEIVDDDDALLLVNQVGQDARFWGFELEGEVTLFEDTRGLLDLRLWTDYVDGELKDGMRIPRLVPLRFGGGLEWERGRTYSGVSVVRVTDHQPDPASLETPTPGYTMVNLHAGYTVSINRVGDFTLFVRATNLADETARRSTSFVKDLAPLPGISGLFGIRARF